MTLDKLKPTERAIIKEIDLSWHLRRKLMELGILAKAEITMLARNPLGGIYLFKIGGTHVAFEEKIARKVEIKKRSL